MDAGEARPIICDAAPVMLPLSEDAGNRLHYHKRLELGVCVSGNGVFYNHDTVQGINTGDIIVFAPGTPHYSRTVDPEDGCFCRFIYIDVAALFTPLFASRMTEQLLRMLRERQMLPVVRKEKDPELFAVLYALAEDCFEDNGKDTRLPALRLAECLLLLPACSADGVSSPFVIDSRIRIAEEYLSAHYNEEISIPQLCELCFLGESQFRRRFKQAYQMSPKAYLHRLRCRIGEELLRHTDLPVSQISEKVGYTVPSEFYRHFSAFTGVSPSVYRREQS